MSTRYRADSHRTTADPDSSGLSGFRPSGRFDALVDLGNPMKGINLFPYLLCCVEGRPLAALNPRHCEEICRTVCENTTPKRWLSDQVRSSSIIVKPRVRKCPICPGLQLMVYRFFLAN